MENEEIINEIRLQVADVIIDLNLIESKLADIISKYINSDRKSFVREILLNSQLMNFSTKFKILKFIISFESLNEPKGFYQSIKEIMNKRNIIAHSDSLLKLEADVIDIDTNWFRDGSIMYPVYGPSEPSLAIINDGKVDYQNISKIVEDFSKYFKIAMDGLNEIDSRLQNAD